MAAIDTDAFGLDWTIDLGETRKRVGNKVALQGNPGPVILVTNPQSIEHEVTASLASFSHGNGHIFNLSHGILQFAPPENAAAMINAVHQKSRQCRTI